MFSTGTQHLESVKARGSHSTLADIYPNESKTACSSFMLIVNNTHQGLKYVPLTIGCAEINIQCPSVEVKSVEIVKVVVFSV